MGISLRNASLRPSLDVAGATASFACALHCAIVAMLLGVLPAASMLAASWIEWAFLAASTVIGLMALVPGYRRHREATPLLLFVAGLAMLIGMRALALPPSFAEMALMLVAASCLILAHWKNRGALHRCACGPRHH
ncbi:MAG TPA: MerC domain-containing protein [Gemmatimonadaceae bacterium]|nr:MerC domain-containing protein [Gemmatimonadaceae bacterium]